MIHTTIIEGSCAPDLVLPNQDGQTVRLSERWHEHPVVLVFLRHFRCPHCRVQAVILHKNQAAFDAAGAEIIMIGLGNPARAREFLADLRLPYLILCDQTKESYQQYGLLRMKMLKEMTTPQSYIRGVQDTLQQGIGISLDQDMQQLGGTFVIDTRGTVRFAYRGERISDRPDVVDILANIP